MKKKTKGNLITLIIPLFLLSVWGVCFYLLWDLGNTIIEERFIPYNIPELPDRYNHDLTCHKIGLYTNWDDEPLDEFFEWMVQTDVGGIARQKFFENECWDTCHKYWKSNKICLAELYP